MGIKHTKVSNIPDSSNTDLVRPSNWNADHTIDGDVNFSGFDITNCGNFPPIGPEGPPGDQGPPGTGTIWVNAEDFGIVGDGVADDTEAIQAAIDYAHANTLSTVFLPSKRYRTTVPLFLDPPGSLRGSPTAWSSLTNYALGNKVGYLGVPWISLSAGNLGNTPAMSSAFWAIDPYNPTNFGFSMTLLGDAACGSRDNPSGAMIRTDFANGCALYVGPGQGNRVAHLTIIGTQAALTENYRGSMHPDGVGIGVTAMNAGTTRTAIDYCMVSNFYKLIKIGNIAPAGGLGDSTQILKCFLSGGHTAVSVESSQALDNTIIDCVMNGVQICVFSAVGGGANVFSGNLSPGLSIGCKVDLTGATNFATVAGPGNGRTHTFDVELTAPTWSAVTSYNQWNFGTAGQPVVVEYGGDLWFAMSGPSLGVPPPSDPQAWYPFDNLFPDVLSKLIIKTDNFGYLPVGLDAYNAATHIASLSYFDITGFNLFTNSTLDTDFAASTDLFLAELPAIFVGSQIKAYGCLIEESLPGPLLIADARAGFGGGGPTLMEGLRLNSDPALSAYNYWNSWPNYTEPGDWAKAEYLCARYYPTFIGSGTGLRIRDCTFQRQGGVEALRVEGANVIIEGNGAVKFHYQAISSDYMIDSLQWLPDNNGHLNDGSVTCFTKTFGQAGWFHSWCPSTLGIPSIYFEHWIALSGVNNAGALPTITHTGTEYPYQFNISPFEQYPFLYGGINYPIMAADSSFDQLRLLSDTISGTKVVVINGRNGVGNIVVGSGFPQKGDVVLWVTDLTNQADAASKFETYIGADNNLRQLDAANLTAVKYQVAIKTPEFVRSGHQGYTYGQDLTTTNVPDLEWSYSGKSYTVYANIALLQLMFPGLMVLLGDPGLAPFPTYHMVMDVQPWLGYFTVNTTLEGTAGVIYTDTTVTQQPFILAVS